MIKTIINGLHTLPSNTVGHSSRALKLSALLLGLLAGTSAYAATYTVNNTSDGVDAAPGDGICETATGNNVCTLRAAIQESNSGISNSIILPAGEYLLTIVGKDENLSATGDLDIKKDVTITGAGQTTTIINGNGGVLNDRVLQILDGATVRISGLTIKNGHISSSVGGGLDNANGTTTLDSVTVSDNIADNPGEITDAGAGGGIYNSGKLTLTSVTVRNNSSDTNNMSTGGGGIYNEAILAIENSTIMNNSTVGASAGGGGLQNTNEDRAGLNNAIATIINTTFSGNNAIIGGGIRNLYGQVNVDLSVFNGNHATTSGGGIDNSGGGMTISRSTVRDNTSSFTGAGVSNFAAMNLSHSAVYDNNASLQGGGIYNTGDGALALLNTTVTRNNATEGGGVYNHRELNATNSTLYNNTSSKPGSEIFACGTKDEDKGLTCSNDSSKVKSNIINSIVGNTTGAAACGGDVSLIISKGYNIDTANTCGFNQTSDRSNITGSAVFAGGFVNNGGPTFTYAILNGSLAHNTGDNINCPVIDQRFKLRDSACDIGAYEISNTEATFQLIDLNVAVTSNVATSGGSPQVTFTITVINNGPSQATGVVLTGQLPPWGKITSARTNINGSNCTSTSETGFQCTLGTINAYASAQVYIVVAPTQAGELILEVDAVADQTDIFRPDSGNTTSETVPVVTGTAVGGPDGGNNFAGKSGGGATDWAIALLLLVPAARRLARRY